LHLNPNGVAFRAWSFCSQLRQRRRNP